MKQRIHDALLGIVGLAGVAFFALSGASCEAPSMQCAVGHGPFFFKYTVTSGDTACYFGQEGEDVGFATYLGVRTDGKEGADYSTRKIAVQSSTLGSIFQDRDGAGVKEGATPYAFGAYTSNPDANDLCHAGGSSGSAALAVADLDIDAFDTGEVDEMTMMPIILPAERYRQEWTNLRFFVTEGVPGTQTRGNMKFENLTPGAECTFEASFIGLYPSVYCEETIYVDQHVDNDEDPATPVENDDEDPTTEDALEPVAVRTEPDDALCSPAAEVGWKKPAPGIEYKNPRIFGSGINPDFKTKCDPVLLHCVLDEGTELVR